MAPPCPWICVPNFGDYSFKILTQPWKHLVHITGDKFQALLIIHRTCPLSCAEAHVRDQKSSWAWLIKRWMPDFLLQIGNSESVTTILLPIPRSALQHDTRDGVVCQLGNRLAL